MSWLLPASSVDLTAKEITSLQCMSRISEKRLRVLDEYGLIMYYLNLEHAGLERRLRRVRATGPLVDVPSVGNSHALHQPIPLLGCANLFAMSRQLSRAACCAESLRYRQHDLNIRKQDMPYHRPSIQHSLRE